MRKFESEPGWVTTSAQKVLEPDGAHMHRRLAFKFGYMRRMLQCTEKCGDNGMQLSQDRGNVGSHSHVTI